MLHWETLTRFVVAMKTAGFRREQDQDVVWSRALAQLRDRLCQRAGSEFWESPLWKWTTKRAHQVSDAYSDTMHQLGQEADDLLGRFLLTPNASGRTSLEVVHDLYRGLSSPPADPQVLHACHIQLLYHYKSMKDGDRLWRKSQPFTVEHATPPVVPQGKPEALLAAAAQHARENADDLRRRLAELVGQRRWPISGEELLDLLLAAIRSTKTREGCTRKPKWHNRFTERLREAGVACGHRKAACTGDQVLEWIRRPWMEFKRKSLELDEEVSYRLLYRAYLAALQASIKATDEEKGRDTRGL